METNTTNRREFLKKAGMAGVATGLSFTVLSSFAKGYAPLADNITYKQQPLPYDYKALEPVIDAMTMELHYSKHGAAYAKALGEAVTAENVNTANTSLESLLGNISKYSTKMRNNAGGQFNHEMFWKSMTAPTSAATKPSGKLLEAIKKDFNSLEAFTAQFTDAGKNRFGSGWAWLVVTKDHKLAVGSTPNQDNPLMDVSDFKGTPLLGLDVWEHAYYLKYQNRRPDYINAWWNVVNWSVVEERFKAAHK